MKHVAPAQPSVKDTSLAIAQLMPQIMRGIQLDFFVKRGVTQTQFLLLAAIRAYPRCTMGALAHNLHVSMPTITGIVDRLVRSGYARRAKQSGDRRQVLVELTEKGQRFLRDFEGVVRRRWEEALQPLKPDELQAFYDVMTKLREYLKGEA